MVEQPTLKEAIYVAHLLVRSYDYQLDDICKEYPWLEVSDERKKTNGQPEDSPEAGDEEVGQGAVQQEVEEATCQGEEGGAKDQGGSLQEVSQDQGNDHLRMMMFDVEHLTEEALAKQLKKTAEELDPKKRSPYDQAVIRLCEFLLS